jgi:hypothetical protein
MVDHSYRQIEAFRLGMYELIPEQVLNLLSDNEVGLHLSGMPKIDGTLYLDFLLFFLIKKLMS